MSCEHTAQTHTRYITDNMHRSHRCNPAAHAPRVCDTPMSAVLLWLVVFVGVFHRLPDFFFIRMYPGWRISLYEKKILCCCADHGPPPAGPDCSVPYNCCSQSIESRSLTSNDSRKNTKLYLFDPTDEKKGSDSQSSRKNNLSVTGFLNHVSDCLRIDLSVQFSNRVRVVEPSSATLQYAAALGYIGWA